MEFREDPDAFDASVERIRHGLRGPLDVPPLIAEYRSGVHSVRDGSHRLEAMRRAGWPAAWVVIWYNREDDFRQDKKRCRKWTLRP